MLGPVQDVKMADFRAWREGYQGYGNVAKLDTECNFVRRRSMIQSEIDSSWQKLWTFGVLAIDVHNNDIADIIDKIYRYLRSQRNPLLDRKDFLNRNQHVSEKVNEYYAELQDLYDSCDFRTSISCCYIEPRGSRIRSSDLHRRVRRDQGRQGRHQRFKRRPRTPRTSSLVHKTSSGVRIRNKVIRKFVHFEFLSFSFSNLDSY